MHLCRYMNHRIYISLSMIRTAGRWREIGLYNGYLGKKGNIDLLTDLKTRLVKLSPATDHHPSEASRSRCRPGGLNSAGGIRRDRRVGVTYFSFGLSHPRRQRKRLQVRAPTALWSKPLRCAGRSGRFRGDPAPPTEGLSAAG